MSHANRMTVKVTEGVATPLTRRLSCLVPSGALLRLQASGNTMLSGLKVLGVRAPEGSGALEVVRRYSRDEMELDWTWHIETMSLIVVRTGSDLPEGTLLEIEVEPGCGLKCSGLTWTLRIGRIKEARSVALEPVAEPLELYFAAGPTDHLEAYLKPDGNVLIQQFDRYGDPTEADDTELVLTAGDKQITVPADKGLAATTRQVPALAGAARVGVVDSAGREALSNAPPKALDGTAIYFGEFHWHSEFSGDGERSIADALTSARDELGLDFAGPTDHMERDGTYPAYAGRAARTVAEQAEICRRFDQPGRFCTIPGAELSGRYGHANVHADNFDVFAELTERIAEEIAPSDFDYRYPLRALADLCPAGQALIVPHHTNMDSYVREHVVGKDGLPFWCAMHWPLPADHRAVRLIEIVQERGSFEVEQPDEQWGIDVGGFGGSVRSALLRGYRLGFTGGTDNHSGWPTRCSAQTAGKTDGYCGLTAILAPKLDTKTLFSSLYQRRCYATSGARIVADATCNGHPIGSELELEPGAAREFRIRIRGTAPIAAVQIINGSEVLAHLGVEKDSWDFDGQWADERPGRPLQDTYYYVRARQVDGHRVWLSPFWIDLPDR